MKKSIKLNKQLRKAALKKGLSQKQVAQLVYFAHTTTNGHFNGYPVPPESAIIEVENEIDYLMAIPDEELTEKQKQAILQYCSEYSDELLFEVSLICKQLELIGMSFMDLMILRTPYWKNKEWIE